MATTTVYPRLFESSNSGYLKRVIDTATFYPRLFEIASCPVIPLPARVVVGMSHTLVL